MAPGSPSHLPASPRSGRILESCSIDAKPNHYDLQRNTTSVLDYHGCQRYPTAITHAFIQPAVHHEPVLQQPASGNGANPLPPTPQHACPAMWVKRCARWVRWWIWMGHWFPTTVCCFRLSDSARLCGTCPPSKPGKRGPGQSNVLPSYSRLMRTTSTTRYTMRMSDVHPNIIPQHGTAFHRF